MELPQDEMLLELFGEFVDQWLTDVNAQYDDFVAAKDTVDFYRFAHTLKGSGYQFGIQPLGDRGIELMALIKAEDWEKIPAYKKLLLDILNDAKESYDEWVAKQ
ncbi:MAG: hypothetical protein LBO69_01560 [Ignavibacteria bacterium]|jgi:chemotaxis protein histidine kinase CheA|nr:hypothetical protein [Ignavibacteria bacterium]